MNCGSFVGILATPAINWTNVTSPRLRIPSSFKKADFRPIRRGYCCQNLSRKEIVGLINVHGGRAVGLSGKDGNLVIARKLGLPLS